MFSKILKTRKYCETIQQIPPIVLNLSKSSQIVYIIFSVQHYDFLLFGDIPIAPVIVILFKTYLKKDCEYRIMESDS